MASRFKFRVEDVMRDLRSTIYGQDETLDNIEDMLKVVWSDITEPDRPLYIAMFLGPTGVGKTEIVRVLTKSIHGDIDRLCRVDMNTLTQEHYAAALTGAPPGYVGSKEGSTILDKEKIEGSFSKPGIVLFDEIEKASVQVIQSLLNIFDNGTMLLTSGQEIIDFRNTMIFMTSNLGAREIFAFADNNLTSLYRRMIYRVNPKHWGYRDQGLVHHVVKGKLEKTFSPEFINRIDDVFVFNWLEKETLYHILDALVLSLNQRINRYHCRVELGDSARAFLIDKGYDKHYGARALKRVFRKHLEVPLASAITEHSSDEGFTLFIAERDKGNLKIVSKRLS
jgi:ATP-dependent Clp protease ATP-binding subunit ClpA